MVSLRDFLDVMEGSKVTLRKSCSSEEVIISKHKLLIHIDEYTYSSAEEVYNDYKMPKVKTWDYYEDRNSDEDILEIWCQGVKMKGTLGDVLKSHFTRETGPYITSEEHSIPESYETNWCEYFDGDVGEFLDRGDMQKLRDLNPVLDCDVRFNGCDCLIYVTIYDYDVLLQDNEE